MMFLIVLIMGIAGLGYLAGYGDVRYPNPNHDRFTTWVYWRYWIMVAVIASSLVAMLIYAYDVTVSVGRIRGFLFWGMAAAIGYTAVFVVWEIIIWTNCTGINMASCQTTRPHFVNRNYPADTTPDPAFLLTLFGAGLGGVGMLVSLYMINQMTCAALATRNVNAQNLGVSNAAATFDDDEYQIQSSIGDHLIDTHASDGVFQDSRHIGLMFHQKAQ
jgi:hypothetical protein